MLHLSLNLPQKVLMLIQQLRMPIYSDPAAINNYLIQAFVEALRTLQESFSPLYVTSRALNKHHRSQLQFSTISRYLSGLYRNSSGYYNTIFVSIEATSLLHRSLNLPQKPSGLFSNFSMSRDSVIDFIQRYCAILRYLNGFINCHYESILTRMLH